MVTERVAPDMGPAGLDVASQLALIADELRSIAANGLYYVKDEYDLVRYQRTRELAAWLMNLVDTRSTVEIQRIFHEDTEFRTPTVAVDGAIFDPEGRLLLAQRADAGTWCMPGGAADVGESPSAGAVREVREETGLTVRAVRLIGAFDNRTWGLPSISQHVYYLVFECEVISGELTTSSETTDFRWVTEEEAMVLPLHGAHVRKVPEAFRLHRLPGAPSAFH